MSQNTQTTVEKVEAGNEGRTTFPVRADLQAEREEVVVIQNRCKNVSGEFAETVRASRILTERYPRRYPDRVDALRVPGAKVSITTRI